MQIGQDIQAEIESDEERARHRPLRILVVTEDDPIYVVQFFRVFLAELPSDEIEFCGVVIDKPFHEPIANTLKRVSSVYGLIGTARLGMRYLKAHLTGDTVEALIRSKNLTVLKTSSVNDTAFVKNVASLAPDLLVSVACPEIFRKELLAVPRLGGINIHSGRLPEYRGMLPTFWQMLSGEPAVTITVHWTVPKVDAGGILATQTFPLKRRDCLDRVIKGTKRDGARLLIRVLKGIRNGNKTSTPMDMSRAGYFTFPKPADVDRFRGLGHTLL